MPSVNDYKFFAGIDMGFKGAIACLAPSGKVVFVHDMPLTQTGDTGTQTHYDVVKLWRITQKLAMLPDTLVGVEWTTTRPDEAPERSRRFGVGQGYVEMALVAAGVTHRKIAANEWKPKLGLPGGPANKHKSCEHASLWYPESKEMFYGPRGGLKDGRAEAVLIAHYLMTNTFQGIQGVVDKWGKGSTEAMAFALSRGGRKRLNL